MSFVSPYHDDTKNHSSIFLDKKVVYILYSTPDHLVPIRRGDTIIDIIKRHFSIFVHL